jgi:homoserine kinase
MSDWQTDPSWTRVFAPATVANVGPGFDCFGFSLGEPGDIVAARPSDRPGVRLLAIEGDGGVLPTEVAANTAGRAALSIWESAPELKPHGLELILAKGLPLCSGLGSSAASAVAGAMAAALVAADLVGLPYDRGRVLKAAIDGEQVASGTRHADNVAPALLGGFTIVRGEEPEQIARFEPVLPLAVAVVAPAYEVPTKAAREALPREVPLADAVANIAAAATLVLALTQGDARLLREALVDRLAEPHRAKLIPGFAAAKQAALDAGAYGCSISGAGPAMFALAPDDTVADAAAVAMARAFAARGIESIRFVTTISSQGARRP